MEVSDLLYHSDARTKIVEGVEKLSRAVSVTLGPKGKNVAIVKPGHRPHLTKDGVTVANAISLKDPFENLGCQIVKEAAQRSADAAGDGTTTSTVIAASLLADGQRLLETGHDARQVVEGINEACEDVLQMLCESLVELKDRDQLVSVATISANGEEKVGELITDAIERVGPDGPITVENARGFDTHLEVVEGTVVDRGYLSPYFATNQTKGIAELEKVCILISNQTLTSAQEILPVLEYVASKSKSLLIVANDVSNEALQTLVLNKMKGSLKVCAIKAPEFGNARTQAMQDLAVVSGGEVCTSTEASEKDSNFESLLGYADKAVIDKNGTLLIGTIGSKEEINLRLEAIAEDLQSVGLSNSEVGVLERRVRRMSEGIAIIRVGGSTEAEMFERRDRVDDALCAARAAKRSGIQPGGGSALVQASKRCQRKRKTSLSNSYFAGYDAFLKACTAPVCQIVQNAGEVPEIVLRKLKKSNNATFGYNAKTAVFGDMFEMRILDPHDVVVSSVVHATSVACNILLIGCAVSISEEAENSHQILNEL